MINIDGKDSAMVQSNYQSRRIGHAPCPAHPSGPLTRSPANSVHRGAEPSPAVTSSHYTELHQDDAIRVIGSQKTRIFELTALPDARSHAH